MVPFSERSSVVELYDVVSIHLHVFMLHNYTTYTSHQSSFTSHHSSISLLHDSILLQLRHSVQLPHHVASSLDRFLHLDIISEVGVLEEGGLGSPAHHFKSPGVVSPRDQEALVQVSN